MGGRFEWPPWFYALVNRPFCVRMDAARVAPLRHDDDAASHKDFLRWSRHMCEQYTAATLVAARERPKSQGDSRRNGQEGGPAPEPSRKQIKQVYSAKMMVGDGRPASAHSARSPVSNGADRATARTSSRDLRLPHEAALARATTAFDAHATAAITEVRPKRVRTASEGMRAASKASAAALAKAVARPGHAYYPTVIESKKTGSRSVVPLGAAVEENLEWTGPPSRLLRKMFTEAEMAQYFSWYNAKAPGAPQGGVHPGAFVAEEWASGQNGAESALPQPRRRGSSRGKRRGTSSGGGSGDASRWGSASMRGAAEGKEGAEARSGRGITQRQEAEDKQEEKGPVGDALTLAESFPWAVHGSMEDFLVHSHPGPSPPPGAISAGGGTVCADAFMASPIVLLSPLTPAGPAEEAPDVAG